MPAKFAVLSSVALACAVAVQGASIVDGRNATLVPRVCQTTGGSPLFSDCVQALKHLATRCNQSNDAYWAGTGSDCKTQVRWGTCKIDVCGEWKAQIADGVNCGGYLQSILNECEHDGRVGGYLLPKDCNVSYELNEPGKYYRLQFSHK